MALTADTVRVQLARGMIPVDCQFVKLYLTSGYIEKIGVLSVSSLFLTRVGVYVGVCVCIRTHTHTVQLVYLDVSPGVGMKHLEGP